LRIRKRYCGGMKPELYTPDGVILVIMVPAEVLVLDISVLVPNSRSLVEGPEKIRTLNMDVMLHSASVSGISTK
jgi:hypothetical protein